MRKLSIKRHKSTIAFFFALFFLSVSQAQNTSNIDWVNDTIPKADAIGARSTYLNNLRSHGNKATELINLPVNKLKDIMDACTANNITQVSVFIITIRQSDVVHFRHYNPSATDEELKGSQLLVFKVPRQAFPGALGAKINLSNNPLMVSLMAAGLVLLDPRIEGLPPSTGSVYLSFGGICPPPASCDTN